VKCTYTFTDISSALINSAKKSLSAYEFVRFATLDCNKPPTPEFTSKFDAIIATNVIHATTNATSTLANLRAMLGSNGLLALVEFTNGIYWFDLVYGLLDGWWLFSDGRKHALADTAFWNRSILDAGYKKVAWTEGDTVESTTMRLICGFNSAPKSQANKMTETLRLSKRAGVPLETVGWKNVDGLELEADIYYPLEIESQTASERPIGRPPNSVP